MSSANKSGDEFKTHSVKSLMYTKKRIGPRILPWGTPDITGSWAE